MNALRYFNDGLMLVINSYASELQTVVNEPIYDGNSYFYFLNIAS